MNLLPEQCRAARGLLNWTQEQLAALAGVSRSTIKDFECHRHALHRTTESLLVDALTQGGVLLLSSDHEGPGVRLKLHARAPKQHRSKSGVVGTPLSDG
ncbi:helix-turn-helix transcriptional regulator [Aminobacter sp. AP02]|uniref:helix-turn-helix domain-containing protein n=1 Tax=Aminobacter sp. AP02 TaxID=2135737 RepID=UPI000D6B5020|nr:helix-turn-helix transcriptional regulator [Aminobacter sp. AP02]PWK77030.1 helix-turn-helix protein [Aminobacter sp. AP02]